MDPFRGQGFRDLRSTAGKLSWLAGVVPRMRWLVSILYAVVASVEADNRTGAEMPRAASRSEKRPKVGLVPVKRIELPRSWLQSFLEKSQLWLVRKEPLIKRQPEFLVVADASPWSGSRPR